MEPPSRNPQGGVATVRAKTAPEARALARCSYSRSMGPVLSRTITTVNSMSVWNKKLRGSRIDSLDRWSYPRVMTDSQQTTLVLGGTGRTGSLVAHKLIGRGLKARTASRHGADVLFDWDDPATHARSLDGVDRVYLVTPVLRVQYDRPVSDFLDLAAGAGVRHVTYLSTYGSDQAPPEADIRAVELDLASRGPFTHSIL